MDISRPEHLSQLARRANIHARIARVKATRVTYRIVRRAKARLSANAYALMEVAKDPTGTFPLARLAPHVINAKRAAQRAMDRVLQ